MSPKRALRSPDQVVRDSQVIVSMLIGTAVLFLVAAVVRGNPQAGDGGTLT